MKFGISAAKEYHLGFNKIAKHSLPKISRRFLREDILRHIIAAN